MGERPSLEQVEMNQLVKCGYCNFVMNFDKLVEHYCFNYPVKFDPQKQNICLADDGTATMIAETETVDLEQEESGNDSNEEENNNAEDLRTECSESDLITDDHEDFCMTEQSEDLLTNENFPAEQSKGTYGPFSRGEFDEHLIGLVQSQPALYDARLDVKERTKLKVNACWKLIAANLGGAPFTPENCSRRWKYLRESYVKARTKYLNNIKQTTKSGSQRINVAEPKFRYYKIMTFLHDVLTYRKTISSLKLKGKKPIQNLACDITVPNRQRSFLSTVPSCSLTEPSSSSAAPSCSSTVPTSSPIASTSLSMAPTTSLTLTSVSNDHCETPVLSLKGKRKQPLQQRTPLSSLTNVTENNLTAFSTPSSSNTKSSNNKRCSDVEREILNMLSKDVKETDEIDAWMFHLGAKVRRLHYKRRAKLELEFLTRVLEEENEQEQYGE